VSRGRVVRLRNSKGLHARAAFMFAEVARRFGASVRVEKLSPSPGGAREADGKEMSDLLLLMVACGDEMRIDTTGEKEEEAMIALLSLIESNFHDEEGAHRKV